MTSELESENEPQVSAIGQNLRAARKNQGWSMRKLASEADVSPSLVSQIENGRVMPSVRTLYSLAEALSLAVTQLVPGTVTEIKSLADPSVPSEQLTPSIVRDMIDLSAAVTDTPKYLQDPILRREDRPNIPLQGGIHWERLTKSTEQGIEFLQTEYPVGATSGKRMSRHMGREFGLILEGELTIEIGFETHVLRAGDSMAFDSNRPHRLMNKGDVPMRAIWVIWEK